MNTKERIATTSLRLFNERGERNVTTNHIAAELGMSPGNLYYHFRNKEEIIYQIFLEYEALVDSYLKPPRREVLTVHDMVAYLEAVFAGFWNYRFLHQDLAHLLDRDARLRRDYSAFTDRCLKKICEIVSALQRSGVLNVRPEEVVKAMALNLWLVVTNWMAFLKSTAGEGEHIDLAHLQKGIYQVLVMEQAFIADEHQHTLAEVISRYRSITVSSDNSAL